jgi:hypothetical protein
MKRARSTLVVIFFLVPIFVLLYSCLNTRFSLEFKEVANFLNYNELAEAFLNGQVHLTQQVDPRRMKSVDPSNPGLPCPYICDAIIYSGNYYFLQEPLPAVFHMISIKFLDRPLPTGIAIILAAIGCSIVMWLILLELWKVYFPDSSGWPFLWTWLAFAAGAAQLYIVSRPVVYNESIAFGVFFLVCASFYFIKSLDTHRYLIRVLLCGSFIGAAILCRLTLVIYAGPFCAAIFINHLMRKKNMREPILAAVYFSLPVIFFVAVLLSYNYLRFGDFLDFGRKYVVLPNWFFYQYCCKNGNFFRLEHIPYNLRTYLLSLPELHWRHGLPWLKYSEFKEFHDGVALMREIVALIFVMMPVLFFSFPYPHSSLLRRSDSKQPILIVMTLTAASLCMFALFLPFVAAQARYLYEFTSLLFPVIAMNIAVLNKELERRPHMRAACWAGASLLLVVNTLMGIYVGLNGMVQWR